MPPHSPYTSQGVEDRSFVHADACEEAVHVLPSNTARLVLVLSEALLVESKP